MKTVCVALPTFNGEKYLLQQINSIVSQEIPSDWDLKILIADDGSTDSSVEIVKNMENLESDLIQFVSFPEKRLGPRRIFEKLGNFSQILNPDLLLFSDQDDLWLPGKIQRTIDMLSHIDSAAVYLGSAMVTDTNLKPLSKTPKHDLRPDFPSILLSNQRPGMTMALNNQALVTWLNATPHHAVMHDWWIQQLLILKGAILITDSEPFVLYRQHEKNTLGIPVGIKGKYRFLKNHQYELFRMRSLQSAELIKYTESLDVHRNTLLVANLINKNSVAITSLFKLIFNGDFFVNRVGIDKIFARVYLVYSFSVFWIKGNEDT